MSKTPTMMLSWNDLTPGEQAAVKQAFDEGCAIERLMARAGRGGDLTAKLRDLQTALRACDQDARQLVNSWDPTGSDVFSDFERCVDAMVGLYGQGDDGPRKNRGLTGAVRALAFVWRDRGGKIQPGQLQDHSKPGAGAQEGKRANSCIQFIGTGLRALDPMHFKSDADAWTFAHNALRASPSWR